MRAGVALSSNPLAVEIERPVISYAMLTNANAAPALKPERADPLRSPSTCPAHAPPTAPFHASLFPLACSAAHDVDAYNAPIAPNSAAPLASAPAVFASAGHARARTTAGASAPHAARAVPTSAPNAADVPAA
eukprot:CAMPEP_0179608882 /NCGR_PEP_ID=MMETSP0930-20121108/2691_1 /TAXON_ID=548131 ORGANISM="Ostreococcus mediterraneus, Strain clade-D-RCC1621" /NCGR_SAMPLE_ID=MMETSP0930 /ASSEMBLY_ACC=CAM_ASM_000580 /LENGTH=132 /DNA_ID=CAMNT_0021477407 /DNA_START=346 /DNA_END=744 /DNA_ORIENTATION=-